MTTPVEKYTAPALEKGLDIIEVLSETDGGLTQAAIARRLGRSVGEIFRMLVVLRRRGLIALDEHSDLYTMTTRLFEIANRTPVVRRLSVAASPVLRALAQSARQSVHVAVLSGESIVVVAQVDTPSNHVLGVRMGARFPIWLTSSGRVILAFQPEETVERYLRDYPPPDDKTTDDLRRDLEAIREARHEVTPSFVLKGVTNVSAPIIGHDSLSVAAMTLTFMGRHVGGSSLEACTDQLLAAAAELSSQIGGTFVPPRA